MATKTELDKSFDKLSETALQVKKERDELLAALKSLVLLITTIRDVYQIDAISVLSKQTTFRNAVHILNRLCPKDEVNTIRVDA